MTVRAGIEVKVIAGAAGGGGGAAFGTFVIWLLGVLVWGAPSSASHAGDAIAAVPVPVSGLIAILVAAAASAMAGYAAPHTSRPPPIPPPG